MKIIYRKKNKFYFKKSNLQNGIALLLSIILSAVFLTVALGVVDIALKELNFSSSAKDTSNAFFAADSGVECALYNDKSDKTVFLDGKEQTISCFENNNINMKYDSVNYSFGLFNLGSDGQSCAQVTVLKTFDSNDPTIVTATKITSKGYNMGYDYYGDGSICYSEATNRVERVLEVNY